MMHENNDESPDHLQLSINRIAAGSRLPTVPGSSHLTTFQHTLCSIFEQAVGSDVLQTSALVM